MLALLDPAVFTKCVQHASRASFCLPSLTSLHHQAEQIGLCAEYVHVFAGLLATIQSRVCRELLVTMPIVYAEHMSM